MDDQISKAVVQERYERLIDVQEAISWASARELEGAEVEVLVTTEGRKNAATGRVSGRARDGRLVHVNAGGLDVHPGDTVRTTVTYAAPHHLVADGGCSEHRRWRGAEGTPAVEAAAPLLTIGRRPE